jgi:potassium/hydrogen antiporter
VARWLKVDAPAPPRRLYPIEFNKFKGLTSELAEMPIPTGSLADGRRIVEMDLPDEFLVILIARGEEFLVPSGGTTLQGGDVMLVLSEKEAFERVKNAGCITRSSADKKLPFGYVPGLPLLFGLTVPG